MAGPLDLASLPWPPLLAAGSLLVLVLFMHRRRDVMHDIGLSKAELVLLTVGPIAGLFVNIPVAQRDNGLLSVNLGGALIPLLIVALWVKRGRLDPVLAILGTVAVSVVAKSIVVFDPQQGIFTSFPEMFLPSAVALVFAVAMSVTRPLRAAPLAYTAGSMGSLVGADLWNLGPILDTLGSTGELHTLSIGGAGVFDMVYLAGMLAMAGALPIVALVVPRQLRVAHAYPPRLPLPADAGIVAARALLLRDPNPRELARAALARSDLALQEQRWPQAIAEAWFAVEALACAFPSAMGRLHEQLAPLRQDRAALEEAHLLAAEGGATRALAGNANHAAKLLVATMEREAPMASRLARGRPLGGAR